jgi:PAS domain S-box-containing protein
LSSSLDGIVTSWNSGAQGIFGYTADEALGSLLDDVMRPMAADDAMTGVCEALRTAASHTSQAVEVTRLAKDGSPRALSIMASRLHDAAGEVVALAAICRDVTAAKRRDDELRKQNDELLSRDRQMRALAARLNAIREEERTRISREVHDELGQLLTGIKMDLRWMERRMAPDSDARNQPVARRLRDAALLVDRTIGSVQRIALELRPSALDTLGFAAALRDEARRFEQRSGLKTEATVDRNPPTTARIATVLFRILQELLTNVARHSQASRVHIEFFESDRDLVLRVQDDGVGMSTETPPQGWGLGLVGIQERAQEVGGSFELAGRPGSGTTATVRIPRPDE